MVLTLLLLYILCRYMPRWVKAKRVCAFTNVAYAGNPAWVILDAQGMTDAHMQQLAGDICPHTDTAFILSEETQEADLNLRFFTGAGEVPFSGHATIAAYVALSGEDMLAFTEPAMTVKQRTKAGIQKVDLRTAGGSVTRATVLLAAPRYLDNDVNPMTVARVLGVAPHDLADTGHPFDVISCGYYDLIVPMKSIADMQRIKPDFHLMSTCCTRWGIYGVTVFCLETFESGDTAFMRHFSPTLGVDEEPISGASAGTLGCHLIRRKLVAPKNFTRMIIEQGYLGRSRGKVYVHIECTHDHILRVRVGGCGVLTFTGYVLTP